MDLLKITYERVVNVEEITLTLNNYLQYGYSYDSLSRVFYKIDEETQERVVFDTHFIETKQTYEHTLPSPSSFSITYSDIDKEGSGRNTTDGNMYRERIGHYCAINVKWDLIPNSKERVNLVRILRNLPPVFTLTYYDSDNYFEQSQKLFYRGDINEELYMFIENNQFWRGLSTTFIQYEIDKYDDQKAEEQIFSLFNIE